MISYPFENSHSDRPQDQDGISSFHQTLITPCTSKEFRVDNPFGEEEVYQVVDLDKPSNLNIIRIIKQ